MYMYISIYTYTYVNVSVLFCCSSPLYLIPQHIVIFITLIYIDCLCMTNLEQTLGLGFSKDMSVLHESKWLLDADRRLHCLGTERENFESSLSGTAVSAPADI